MNTLSAIAYREGFSLPHTAILSEAMSCMLENRNGSVVLLKEQRPVGILTEGMVLDLLEDKVDFTQEVLPFSKQPVVTANYKRPIESAFDLVVTNNIRRLVLIDDGGCYAGMVLQDDLFAFLEEDVYKADLKVVNILSAEMPQVMLLSAQKTLHDALRLMRHQKVGSVIIADDGDVKGIITEKDILAAGHQHKDLQQNVTVLMSSPVLSAGVDDAITTVIAQMKEHSVRRVLVYDRKGKVYAVLTNRDIFKHIKGNVARMLEIKLRHAKEIMDMLPHAIIEIYDAPNQQVIHWINRKAREQFGDVILEHAPEELFGETWQALYASLRTAGVIESFSVAMKGRIFEFSGTVSKNINSRYIKLIAKDVTEHETIKQHLRDEVAEESKLRREQEYLMMQQSRLASMGEMIGHIAHQWRQPLAQLGGIFMNLESAQVFGELDDVYLKKKMKHGNAMIKYMSQTIDDFRLFFTPNENSERFDVVLALYQAVNIVSAGLDYHHIDVQINAKPEKFFARKYASEFAQVLLNLLNNSKDALAQSNNVKRYIHISLSKDKNENVLVFCDNGGGVNPLILSEVFKPYVSTKHDKGGTGIGLYMSQLIMEQKMNGSIKAQNNEKGVCFTLRFPSD